MNEPVVPSEVYRFYMGGDEVLLSPEMDRIDRFSGFGHYILKVLVEEEDQAGMREYHIPQALAEEIHNKTSVPMCDRFTISERENEGRIGYLATILNDSILYDPGQ
jgi:hypothetical protein